MSSFKDLTITHNNALSTHNILAYFKLPSPLKEGALIRSMEPGTCPLAGYTLKSESDEVCWAEPIGHYSALTYEDVHTPPAQASGTWYADLTTVTGNQATISGTVNSSGNAYLFGSSENVTAISKMLPMNATTVVFGYQVPAGKEIRVTFRVDADIMKHGTTNVYGCAMSNNSTTLFVQLSSALTPSPTSGVIARKAITLPLRTTLNVLGVVTATLSATNNSATTQMIYVHAYLIQSGLPIYSIKTSSSGSVLKSGTLNMYLKTTTSAALYTPAATGTTNGTFPSGKPYYDSSKTGFIYVDRSGDFSMDTKADFAVMHGGYGLLLDSSGLYVTADSGFNWNKK